MIESLVFIENEYSEVCKRYVQMTGSAIESQSRDNIICDNMLFEDYKGWCMINLLLGENFAEEVLLELSDGKRLLYFYSNDSQMDCEFVVIENNEIIRKRYIYSDTPELNEDEGCLDCENVFEYWNDIDYLLEKAKVNPMSLFE